MLLSKDAIADVVEQLSGSDFYRPAHETIYSAVLDLYGRGEPADAVTVTAEMIKLLGKSPPSVAARAETIIVTIGNHARGETGLKIWISGFSAAFAVADRPARMPKGTATMVAIRNPKNTVWIDVQIC